MQNHMMSMNKVTYISTINEYKYDNYIQFVFQSMQRSSWLTWYSVSYGAFINSRSQEKRGINYLARFHYLVQICTWPGTSDSLSVGVTKMSLPISKIIMYCSVSYKPQPHYEYLGIWVEYQHQYRKMDRKTSYTQSKVVKGILQYFL